MSTSLLYHAFGIRGYKYVSSRYDEGKVTFQIYKRKTDLCCSACGSRDVVCKGTVPRSIRTVPIGLKSVIIDLPVQRVLCRTCKALKQVKIGFADWRRS
jgi:transposase